MPENLLISKSTQVNAFRILTNCLSVDKNLLLPFMFITVIGIDKKAWNFRWWWNN